MIPLERASQEEQNGANFNFVTSFSEELCECGKKYFVVYITVVTSFVLTNAILRYMSAGEVFALLFGCASFRMEF